MKIFYDEEVINKKGVYKINIDNTHLYIGQTSRSFWDRWREHWNSYNNKTCNKKFKKHLKSNSTLTFTMLKECHTKKECERVEKYFINYLHPDLNVKLK